MYEHDKTEVAYKNGYDKGLEDAIKMGYAVPIERTVKVNERKTNIFIRLIAILIFAFVGAYYIRTAILAYDSGSYFLSGFLIMLTIWAITRMVNTIQGE